MQLAQYDKAEADFEKADALDPRQSVGSAAEGSGRGAAKRSRTRTFDRASEIGQETQRSHFFFICRREILTQRGPDPGSAEFRQAVESARKAISLRPSLATARDILAKLYLQAGQNGAAIEQSRKALNSDPKDQTALYHLIQALRKSGQTPATFPTC